MKKLLFTFLAVLVAVFLLTPTANAQTFTNFPTSFPTSVESYLKGLFPTDLLDKLKLQANTPIHVFRRTTPLSTPAGLNPSQIKAAYNLPTTGGNGTIAIVDSYDNPYAAKDLATFSTQYNLPQCTTTNGCFTQHKMSNFISRNSGWILEESLDVQWAHAIAPSAKILLVEARTSNLSDLLNAVAWAKQQPGVVAVSLSWGSNEFSQEQNYDGYFSQPGVAFFASSGDSGNGVIWPSVSSKVTGVGGTTLNLSGNTVSSEVAWSGSGGGKSSYIAEPSFQTTYGITNSNNMRAVPDVSFDADPATGVSVYDSYGYNFQRGWFVIGGTSVGAPSWSAIHALGSNAVNDNFYTDAKTNYANYFRDITSGNNGNCGVLCQATSGYDFITGLGSPVTSSY